MARYTVNHVLQGPAPVEHEDDWRPEAQDTLPERKTFRPNQVVTEQELIEAGFDGRHGRHSIESLRTPKPGGFPAAITVVPGTEDLTPEIEQALRARMAPKADEKTDEKPDEKAKPAGK